MIYQKDKLNLKIFGEIISGVINLTLVQWRINLMNGKNKIYKKLFLLVAIAIIFIAVPEVFAENHYIREGATGTNNGSDWTELDSQTGQYFGDTATNIYPVLNTTSYTYYRITTSAGSGSYIAIGEIQFMEGSPAIFSESSIKTQGDYAHPSTLRPY